MVAVISVVPYLTIKDEHTMLYKVTKTYTQIRKNNIW